MSIGGSSPPYSTIHDFQYPFLDFPWDKIPMKFKMGSEYPHYYRHEF